MSQLEEYPAWPRLGLYWLTVTASSAERAMNLPLAFQVSWEIKRSKPAIWAPGRLVDRISHFTSQNVLMAAATSTAVATIPSIIPASSGEPPVITMSGPLSSIITGGSGGWGSLTLPLTTVFTPPPSCSTRHLTVLGLEGVDRFYGDKTAYRDAGFIFGGINDTAALSCYPSGFATVVYSSVATFSPGICPRGYTTAATRQYNSTVAYETTLTYNYTYPSFITTVPFTTTATRVTTAYSTVAGATVTAATCCLSSFSPVERFGCTSIMTTATEALLLETIRSPTSIVTLTALPITVAAPQIVVEWKSEDLSLFNSASSSASSVTQKSSLSSGAKAGIIVAAVVGFLLIVGLSFLLIRLRRNQRTEN